MSDDKHTTDPIDNFLILLSNYLYINQHTNASAQYFQVFKAVKSISGHFIKNSQRYHEPANENPDIARLSHDIKTQLLDIIETHFDDIYTIGTQAPLSSEPLEYSQEITNNALAVLIQYLQETPDHKPDDGPDINILYRKKIMTAVKNVSPEFLANVQKHGAQSAQRTQDLSRLSNTTKNQLCNIFLEFHGVFLDYLDSKKTEQFSVSDVTDHDGSPSIGSPLSIPTLKEKFASTSDFSKDTDSSDLSNVSTIPVNEKKAVHKEENEDELYPDDFEDDDSDPTPPTPK